MDHNPNQSPVLADTVPANHTRFSSGFFPYSSLATVSSGLLATITKKMLIPGNLDDALLGDFLDTMQSSSPPKIKLKNDRKNNPVSDESAYVQWTLKYPSALTKFEQIANHARGKIVALFLDYDGTLSPIVSEPDSAFMSDKMRTAVKNAAEYFPTAIISGRSRDKVFDFVGLTELYYAGSHGMDIMGPVRDSDSVSDHPNCIRTIDNQGKESHLFQPASKFIPTINESFRSLVVKTKGIKGAKVENNKFCVSVHYRQVEEKNWPLVKRIVLDILKDYPNLRMTYGRKVLEVRPVIDWNKGKAVEFLLESLGLSNSEDVLSIYVGDDRTDEDAFEVLREKNCGYGILVSSVPKESHAFYSLKDTSEVLLFLKSLVNWKKPDT